MIQLDFIPNPDQVVCVPKPSQNYIETMPKIYSVHQVKTPGVCLLVQLKTEAIMFFFYAAPKQGTSRDIIRNLTSKNAKGC